MPNIHRCWEFLDKMSDIFPCHTGLVLGAQYSAEHNKVFKKINVQHNCNADLFMH
jgi:hypothetical protein